MKISVSDVFSWIRRFFAKLLTKDALVFLFCLLLSGIFWFGISLQESYEKEFKIPVSFINVPKNVVFTSAETDSFTITVSGKGMDLLTHAATGHAVKLDFSKYANKDSGKIVVTYADVQKRVRQSFGTSKITTAKPDRLTFYYNYGQSKRVAIKLQGKAVPDKNRYLAQVIFKPEKITIYASRKILDSIQYVRTMPLNVVNFQDTTTVQVALKSIRGVKMVPSTVSVTLCPDILVESGIEVPITTINTPKGVILRTFPSKVRVKFVAGMGKTRAVKADDFVVEANYNDVVGKSDNKQKSCPLTLRSWPKEINKPTLELSEVDYVIEQ